jgi:hypothetical protein
MAERQVEPHRFAVLALDRAPGCRETVDNLQSAAALAARACEDNRAVGASISDLDVQDRSVDADLHFDKGLCMDHGIRDQLADEQHDGLTVFDRGPRCDRGRNEMARPRGRVRVGREADGHGIEIERHRVPLSGDEELLLCARSGVVQNAGAWPFPPGRRPPRVKPLSIRPGPTVLVFS